MKTPYLQKIVKPVLQIPYQIVKLILMRPAPFNLTEYQKKWSTKGKSFFFEVKTIGKQIRVYEYGEGPTILLIHGWAGCGLQLSPLIQPLLDVGFKTVLFDAPGHGESEGVGSTYLEFVQSLSELAQQYPDLKGVIAHSMGGGAAVVLADQISRADFKTVLMAPHYDMKAEFYAWAKSLRFILKIYIRLSEKLFQYKFNEINPKNLLKNQKGPFLIIHDMDDQASRYTNSELLHQYLSNSKLIKTVGKGHNRILKDLGVLKAVSSFLAN